MSASSLLAIGLMLVAGTLLGGIVTYLLLRRAASREDGSAMALAQLQLQVSDLIRTLHDTRHQITHETGSQLQSGTKALTDLVQTTQTQVTSQVASQSREVGEKVGALQEKLARLDEEIRHLSEFGKDLRRLQDILRAPKVRGGLGEQLLESLLANVLPARDYQIQFAFASGEKVDAVIRLPGGLVPVDAKFPLENFQRVLDAQGEEEGRRARRAFLEDIRRHGRAIASKYIRPSEGTLDLALMYVPAENVYYEAFVHGGTEGGAGEIWNEVLALRVFPVSPNTFSLYLSTLQIGLRGMRIEEGARRIVATLSTLQGDLGGLREAFELMAKHLVHAARNLDEVRRRLEGFEWKIAQVESPVAEPGTRASRQEA
ncbi:MAG TPA: DNA recombination protein RmuC [Candidatus Polarisedimenticolia bacterium]|nr:DNA recombination protein RmuC [Candidatus Polarisedimenticolia bacterium]